MLKWIINVFQSVRPACWVVRSHCDLIKWSLHLANTGTSYSCTIGGSLRCSISFRCIVLDSSAREKQRWESEASRNTYCMCSNAKCICNTIMSKCSKCMQYIYHVSRCNMYSICNTCIIYNSTICIYNTFMITYKSNVYAIHLSCVTVQYVYAMHVTHYLLVRCMPQ